MHLNQQRIRRGSLTRGHTRTSCSSPMRMGTRYSKYPTSHRVKSRENLKIAMKTRRNQRRKTTAMPTTLPLRLQSPVVVMHLKTHQRLRVGGKIARHPSGALANVLRQQKPSNREKLSKIQIRIVFGRKITRAKTQVWLLLLPTPLYCADAALC